MVRYMPRLEAISTTANLDVRYPEGARRTLGTRGEGLSEENAAYGPWLMCASIDELKHYRDHFIRLPHAAPVAGAARDEPTAGGGD